ncbi:MAG TPA: hypothetical protein ENH99_00540 [Candidatus Pacearchaeota archaeon]|nr:hypothetical protein [Candidatus Pacearchaeota archaeon]
MDLDKAIQSRKSVKRFNSKKPDWRDILEAINAARYAPMAGNNYTLRFILISDKEKINKIAECAQQDFVSKAHYLVIACSNLSRVVNSFEERGETYTKQQAGAAIQNFLLKAEELGLATCWVGHFVESQIKRDLKIPKDVNVEAILPIGFEYQKKRTRKAPCELDKILYFEKYGQRKMKEPKKIDV